MKIGIVKMAVKIGTLKIKFRENRHSENQFSESRYSENQFRESRHSENRYSENGKVKIGFMKICTLEIKPYVRA